MKLEENFSVIRSQRNNILYVQGLDNKFELETNDNEDNRLFSTDLGIQLEENQEKILSFWAEQQTLKHGLSMSGAIEKNIMTNLVGQVFERISNILPPLSKDHIDLMTSMSIITLYTYIETYLESVKSKIIDQTSKKDPTLRKSIDQGFNGDLFSKMRFITKQINLNSKFQYYEREYGLSDQKNRFQQFRDLRNKLAHSTISIFKEITNLEDRVNRSDRELRETMVMHNNEAINEEKMKDNISDFIKPILPMFLLFHDGLLYVAMFDAIIDYYFNNLSINEK